jgi:hypothetical protein
MMLPELEHREKFVDLLQSAAYATNHQYRHSKLTHFMLTMPSPCCCFIYWNCVGEYKYGTGMQNKLGLLDDGEQGT